MVHIPCAAAHSLWVRSRCYQQAANSDSHPGADRLRPLWPTTQMEPPLRIGMCFSIVDPFTVMIKLMIFVNWKQFMPKVQ